MSSQFKASHNEQLGVSRGSQLRCGLELLEMKVVTGDLTLFECRLLGRTGCFACANQHKERFKMTVFIILTTMKIRVRMPGVFWVQF